MDFRLDSRVVTRSVRWKSPPLRDMRLPSSQIPPSQAHLTLAQEAISCGAAPRALQHLDRALVDGAVEDLGIEGMMEAYHRLLKQGRRTGGPETTQIIIDHMILADIPPDTVAAHLAAADAAHRGRVRHGLQLLAACGTAGATLSTGSFDTLIHAAGKSSYRDAAFAAYRAMRRHRLKPTDSMMWFQVVIILEAGR